MASILVIDSNSYKPTQATIANDDNSFVSLIKEFLQVIVDERLSGASNYQNIKQFITNCSTFSQLSDINSAFITSVNIKWYILTAPLPEVVPAPEVAPEVSPEVSPENSPE